MLEHANESTAGLEHVSKGCMYISQSTVRELCDSYYTFGSKCFLVAIVTWYGVDRVVSFCSRDESHSCFQWMNMHSVHFAKEQGSNTVSLALRMGYAKNVTGRMCNRLHARFLHLHST